MRITFVSASADMSGGFRVIAGYARELMRRGHDVLVVTRPWPQPRLTDRLRSALRGDAPRVDPRRAPSHLDGTGVPHRRLDRFRPITAQDLPDADVVIATWWESVEWVAALPPSKGAKLHLIEDYEIWLGDHTVDRVDATCRLPIPKVTPSRWVQELLVTRFDQQDVTLIPLGVDLERFRAPERGRQRVPTVGFMYTTFRNKGCDVSIEACKIARASLPDLMAVSFGIEDPSSGLPFPPNTKYHHRAPEASLNALYASCDAWLFGSRKEGYGLPILEAMACRTPVIACPAGAAPELLRRGGGLLVPAEDPRAMAEAIVSVCGLPDPEWRALSERAHATAHCHSWARSTDAFETVLTRVYRAER
jgi:glycosyltransferase involved in cell wall biosynthesis